MHDRPDSDQLLRRNYELSVLNSIASALNGSADLERVLQIALEQVADLLDLHTGWIWLLDEAGDAFELVAARNLPPGLADQPQRMEGGCYCQGTFLKGDQSGAAAINVVTCSRLAKLESGTDGLACHASIPLYAGAQKLGILNVASADWRQLSEADLRLLHTVGDLLGIALERTRQTRQLAEQNRALEAANHQIQTATQRKSDFLARMSHDLRTPMNAIIGYTRLVMRKSKENLEGRQYQNLEHIRTSADHLLRLINDILDLSKIEAGHIDLAPAPVDVARLLEECATTVAPLVKPGVDLQCELAAIEPLYTDAERLRRIAMNLLGNAVKFTDSGRIELCLHPWADGIELTLCDTGVGIPAKALPHIFDEFKQVDEQDRPQREGSGLGLAIAKRSIDLLGGTIEVASSVGRGTTFTLRLKPYCPEKPS